MKLKALTIALLVATAWVVPAMAQSSHVIVWENSYNEVNPGDTVTAWIKWNAIRQWEINYLYVVFWYDDGDGPSDPSVIDSGSVETVWEDESHTSRFYERAQETGQTITQYGGFYGWGANTQYYLDVNNPLWDPHNGEYAVGFKWDIPLTATPGSECRIGLEYADGRWSYPPQNVYDYDRIENNGVPLDPDCLTIKVLGPPPPPLGSFDGDQDVDDIDIDLLCNAIRTGSTNFELFDISADGTTHGTDGAIDTLDLDYLVRVLVETAVGEGTEYGDFNLDGKIDTTDLTRLATNYGAGDWKWDDGNANGYIDTNIDNTDLTILATYYGFGVPDVVPEPATLSLLALGAAALIRRRK